MTDTTAPAAKVPWHFWLVCAVAVLWNGFGAYDFTMSVTQGEAYYRQMGMTDAQVAYMNAFPTWMYLPWILGVWGSVAGTILLLLRRRWAFHAFVVSLIGLVISLIYQYVLTDGREVMGAGAWMSLIILVGCLFFVWYSRMALKKGLLS